MSDNPISCPLTQFSDALLNNTSLKNAFYHLQHRSGFNINIILYLLWLAKACHGRLTKKQIQLLESHIILWHQRVVSELKYTHALVADQTDPAVVHIKEALQTEIVKAHHIEQQMLFDSESKRHVLKRNDMQQLADACANLSNYCETRQNLLIDEDEKVFFQIFCVMFDELNDIDIRKQLVRAFVRFTLPGRPVQMTWKDF
ncbi:MAG TPA: DUF2390 domain-containing protein [Coxiellaceae bacterium]|nr:DUF2390 domain-containing protein [Coxiellaceae bacterium]